MKTLKVIYDNTSEGPVEIDQKQVQKYLQAVSWQSMVPEEIAYILMKQTAPWRPEDVYIPKSSIGLPPAPMPFIYFFSLVNSFMNGEELVLVFTGPYLNGWDVYEKFGSVYIWDNIRAVARSNDIDEIEIEIIGKIPARQDYTGPQWLDNFIDAVVACARNGKLAFAWIARLLKGGITFE